MKFSFLFLFIIKNKFTIIVMEKKIHKKYDVEMGVT